MLPDLARQLHLVGYHAHEGAPFGQDYVVPGTVDPEVPTDVNQDDNPHADHLALRLDEHANFNYLLDCLDTVVQRNRYETHGPVLAGGKSQASLGQIANATGVGSVYTIPNPFDTDGEWCALAAAFGAAGQAMLSNDPNQQGPALSAFYDGPQLTRGLPFFAAGVTTIAYSQEAWFPIQASDSLFWSVNMTAPNTSSAIIALMFRRRLTRHGKPYLTNR